MRAATATLRDLRSARDQARAEYLAATRQRSYSRDTAARGWLWREFLQANAAYLRAKGQTR
jgi:hypothetical protein